MTRVKICGVNDAAAFDAAVEARADWIGLVFFARSPRHVTPAHAAALSGRTRGGPLRVGLFVSPSDDDVSRALDALPLDVLQLYAPAARRGEIQARFGLPVWQCVGVTSPADLPGDAGEAAALVMEGKPPEGADRPGGLAKTFDWRLLRGWTPPRPWLLAGGLTPRNVAQAIAISGAQAVDVSSGVEAAPGRKEAGLISAFVAAARQ